MNDKQMLKMVKKMTNKCNGEPDIFKIENHVSRNIPHSSIIVCFTCSPEAEEKKQEEHSQYNHSKKTRLHHETMPFG